MRKCLRICTTSRQFGFGERPARCHRQGAKERGSTDLQADVAHANDVLDDRAVRLAQCPTSVSPIAAVGSAISAAASEHECLKVLVTPLEGLTDR